MHVKFQYIIVVDKDHSFASFSMKHLSPNKESEQRKQAGVTISFLRCLDFLKNLRNLRKMSGIFKIATPRLQVEMLWPTLPSLSCMYKPSHVTCLACFNIHRDVARGER